MKTSNIDLINGREVLHTWHGHMKDTPIIKAAHDAYLDDPHGCFINGVPISRRNAGWYINIVIFASIFQYARSLE